MDRFQSHLHGVTLNRPPNPPKNRSSSFRPFRHTSTATALNLVSALCDVARIVQNELEVVTRQLQAEQKKRGDRPRIGEREAGLADRSQDLHGKKVKLGEVLAEFFDGWVSAGWRG
ncbi:hypothetical protein BC938DRAFT_476789 [Jimgerdemannia flammicorona]|uniref:STAG domain-containing protein n=1 Tax=Jimgerdemannia flammicorona TaxID=994334 RepID=A0A433PEF0_9FUNG|nr:hypothetical protein BC938DRAFT_476789 [Jimgerdemannia flammicorona]